MVIYKFIRLESYRTLDMPHKSAQAELGSLIIEFTQAGKHRIHTAVVDHCNHGRCKRRPCVLAVVRLAVPAAAARNLIPGRESAAVHTLEHIYDSIIMRLVEGDENSFHYTWFERCTTIIFSRAMPDGACGAYS